MGGKDSQGNVLEVTNFNMSLRGKPYFVISGKFHYSHYLEAYWEEELLKVKAGGVNTVATYIFWIFHEKEQGIFAWEGQRNLRQFIKLCAKHELKGSIKPPSQSYGVAILTKKV
jgi:beta-galactosidase